MKTIDIKIKGNNIKVTTALKNYIDEKIGKLPKYYDRIQSAEVELIVQDNKSAEESQKVEVTLFANGTYFRCEEASISMYASIDIVAEKLSRQLQRYKQKIQRGRGATKADFSEENDTAATTPEPRVVKTKRFAVKPMNPIEASMQMEMLNHTFFVFLNVDSDQVNVIYKRNDGDYGLIEPEME